MSGGNKNYKAGYRAELRAMKDLKRSGYLVMRTAGSHGPFDVIAVGKANVRLIQVKVCPKGKLPSFKGLLDDLSKLKLAPCVEMELWVYEKFTGWHYQTIKL